MIEVIYSEWMYVWHLIICRKAFPHGARVKLDGASALEFIPYNVGAGKA